MEIYLDNAATTKPYEEVIQVAETYMRDKWYNPSALYKPATRLYREIKQAKENVAKFIGCDPDELIWTSGSTEANNTVLNSFFRISILSSAVEHNDIVEREKANAIDYKAHEIAVNRDGTINFESLNNKLEMLSEEQPFPDKLVTVIGGNNEIGTINNIKKIAETVHQYKKCYCHCDMTQMLCHVPFSVHDLGVDYASFSAQKIHGLKGFGMLYVRKGVPFKTFCYGTQQGGRRAGTENVVGIMTTAKAIELCDFGEQVELSTKRDYFIKQLKEEFNVQINGSLTNRLPNNISCTFVNQRMDAEALVYMLDMDNIYISTGSACNSRKNERSKVLQAIGLSDDDIDRTVRMTLPEDITYSQIDYVIDKLYKDLRLMDAR